jgi:hypothetical protein
VFALEPLAAMVGFADVDAVSKEIREGTVSVIKCIATVSDVA